MKKTLAGSEAFFGTCVVRAGERIVPFSQDFKLG
jgi:hypothetical protein